MVDLRTVLLTTVRQDMVETHDIVLGYKVGDCVACALGKTAVITDVYFVRDQRSANNKLHLNEVRYQLDSGKAVIEAQLNRWRDSKQRAKVVG